MYRHTCKHRMLTVIVLVDFSVKKIKEWVVSLKETATEPVGSSNEAMSDLNLSCRMSENESECTVSACTSCGDSAAQRKSVAHHPPESPANSKNDSTGHREKMLAHYFTKDICTFAGGHNNLWIGPTLQATLHLRVIQDKLQQQTPKDLIKRSNMPKFAKFFLTALKNPGKQFTNINEALLELSAVLPNSNEPKSLFCFLDHMLLWFEKCGLHTTVTRTKTITCETCQFGTSRKLNLGRIIVLPQPTSPNQSTHSLLNSTFRKKHCTQKCANCKSNLQEKMFWNALDVLILHLPEENGPEPRHPVAASEFLTIYTSEEQKIVYNLSSIISYSSVQQRFWAALLKLFVTIKADDHLSVMRRLPQETLDEKIYLYESVHV